MPRSLLVRHLVLVLGDQLDRDSAALDGFDPARDHVLMIESAAEARQVWNHKARIALFLAAMRHHADWLRARAWTVHYLRTEVALDRAVALQLAALRPRKLIVVEPGAWRLREALIACCAESATPLEIRADRHFLVSTPEFADWAQGRIELRMEHFYRMLRRRTGILMEGGEPRGGRWNFDADNRSAFGRHGPGAIPRRLGFPPDALTTTVLAEVEQRYSDHPGTLANFDWPVTREDALAALADFVSRRLPEFGRYQDAMWTDEPFLYHSALSAALNLKLLDPREVIEAALASESAPLAAVEGFVRQILGWREFMRGVYWLEMPALDRSNHYGHRRALPAWYWTGATRMACMAQAIGQTLELGYAHHIQRLMVTGLFGLLAEIEPRAVADWYLAVYVDAVEWVEHPNVLGMALYANGGRYTSKPYIASGAYVARMSNYCAHCPYDPRQRTGPRACPLTTLYWRFLDRHEHTLGASGRTSSMVRNLARMTAAERSAIRSWGDGLLERLETV